MLALRLYQLLVFLAAPFLHRRLARRAAQGREDPARLREKFGHAALKRPPGHLVWLHAASVGETNSILPLVEDILTAHPAQQILLTTGTLTSAHIVARWQSAHGDLRARLKHQFAPLDRPAYIRRFLEHWQPQAALWVESEIWPNLVLACTKRDIPLIMLNGRLSAKSFAGWRRVGTTARHIFARFNLLMAQDETTAERLSALGATHIKVPGNLKLDAPPLAHDTAALAKLQEALAGRACFLAASTHPGEEVQIADALRLVRKTVSEALAIIVPRHPDRGDALADELRAQGYTVAQRSKGDAISPTCEIYLADTLGEMGLFYRLADIVLMGGTLVPHGGQNPVEAAQLNCALLAGPHTDNFTEIFAALTGKQAVASVSDAATLATQVTALLQNPNGVRMMATAAADYAEGMRGTRARVLQLIAPYLVDPKAAPKAAMPREAHDG